MIALKLQFQIESMKKINYKTFDKLSIHQCNSLHQVAYFSLELSLRSLA